ncbi:MAG: hypothetical protein H7196_01625 [candidate division SR1 bacterium]|nr:hypothetical protein [candidate division SR1 bacterium]
MTEEDIHMASSDKEFQLEKARNTVWEQIQANGGIATFIEKAKKEDRLSIFQPLPK